MATIFSHTEIPKILQQQQETVGIVDKYIQSVQLSSTIPNFYADYVMRHLFVNIRNSYQDGIFLSQGLINNTPYYVSAALSHAQRTAQESLIDLAYIMSNLKHMQGHEYLRYLKFIVDKHAKLSGKNSFTKDRYNEIFPPNLNLKPKSSTQWSHIHPKDKIEKGLKLYKIERPDFADFRYEFHSDLSSTAHGNDNTIHILMQTPEENRPKLEADFQLSIPYFDAALESGLKCYVKFYLGRNKDYEEIVKSMFPGKGGSHGK